MLCFIFIGYYLKKINHNSIKKLWDDIFMLFPVTPQKSYLRSVIFWLWGVWSGVQWTFWLAFGQFSKLYLKKDSVIISINPGTFLAIFPTLSYQIVSTFPAIFPALFYPIIVCKSCFQNRRIDILCSMHTLCFYVW